MAVEMRRSLEVRVPGHPPGGNALHRMQHWQVRKVRDEWRQAAFILALDARPGEWAPLDRASVAVYWRFRVRRKRDLDNLVAGLKPLLDGLVDAGVLVDDSSDHLISLGPLAVEVGARQDETVLVVTEERHG